MDLTTIIGLIAGLAAVVYGIGWGDLRLFFSLDALLITVGGALAATLMSYPLKTILGMGGVIKQVVFSKRIDMNEDIESIIDIANVMRREGLLALEDAAAVMDNSFLRKGIMLMAAGADKEPIQSVMEAELEHIRARHVRGADVMAALAGYGPAFGMIGTLIGLVKALGSIDDPAALSAGMAAALMATLYGVVFANLIATPIEKKLRALSEQEICEKEMLLVGLMAVHEGDSPRIIREKLLGFISRKDAAKIDASPNQSIDSTGL